MNDEMQTENYLEDMGLTDNKKSCVYFITDGQYVKIGQTDNIEKRMKSLQTGNPKKLSLIHVIPTDEPNLIEWGLHKRYEKQRVRGEWFDILGEVLATRGLDDPYLTPHDIELLLKVSHATVYKLITREDFPAIKIGKSYRVRKSDLEMYLKLSTPMDD